MPRRDGTGPVGIGQMTGRGNGNCQGNKNPQELGVGHGRGAGNCNRHGQNFSSNLQPLAQDELTFLKNKANKMESKLSNVKSRILELEQDK